MANYSHGIINRERALAVISHPADARSRRDTRRRRHEYSELEVSIDALMKDVRDTTDVSTSFQLDMWMPLARNEQRRDVLEMVRAAVADALDHSACTHISVSLKQDGARRDVRIADNGPGTGHIDETGADAGTDFGDDAGADFRADSVADAGADFRANSERNRMAAIAKRLDGSVEYRRRPKGGTAVRLTFRDRR